MVPHTASLHYRPRCLEAARAVIARSTVILQAALPGTLVRYAPRGGGAGVGAGVGADWRTLQHEAIVEQILASPSLSLTLSPSLTLTLTLSLSLSLSLSA